MNNLEPCIYCPGQRAPRSRAKRQRLKDTRQNRAREIRLYFALAAPGAMTIRRGRAK